VFLHRLKLVDKVGDVVTKPSLSVEAAAVMWIRVVVRSLLPSSHD
jgi:hypothetical protein